VFRAWYYESGGWKRPLREKSLNELDRDAYPYQSVNPGTPVYFAQEQYKLYICPAPSYAGTLEMMGARGIMGPLTDNDSIQSIPLDFEPAVLYKALEIICRSVPDDIEARSRLQAFIPLAEKGMVDLENWSTSVSTGYQARLVPHMNYRRLAARGR